MLQIGPQDMGRKREFETNGVKFIFEASDPYGFITASCRKNNKMLDGFFTTFKDAENAAIKYATALEVKKANLNA